MKSAVTGMAACAVALALVASPAAAQEYDHIVKLANTLAKHADHLHDEADRHFKDRPLLHKHAREIEKEARHIARHAGEKKGVAVLRRHLKEIHDHVDHLKTHADKLPNNEAARHFRSELAKVHATIKHLEGHFKPAAAIEYDHVVKLARTLARHADHLHDEADRHFKDRPLLHKHAREIEREAKHIATHAAEKRSVAVLRRHVKEVHDHVDHLKTHADKLPNSEAARHFRAELKKVHSTVKHIQEHLEK